MQELFLGVNIDHIATLRNARGTNYPDPIHAASIAENAGADGITVHLREDRRHITDRDVKILSQTIQTRMNLEMALTDEMLDIAVKTKPAFVCLVPEKREEVTTEGGLNVLANVAGIKAGVARLQDAGIAVSLFIDAERDQIQASKDTGAEFVEIHTGHYANLTDNKLISQELEQLKNGIHFASQIGLSVNAGHGLHYHNVKDIAAMPELIELNIGHAIIARAAFDGLDKAVREMKKLMQDARLGI